MSEAALARPTILTLAAGFAVAGPILSVTPLGMAPLLFATALLATASERIFGHRWARVQSQFGIISSILLSYCALSLAWSFNPGDGARKLIDIVAVLLSALLIAGLAPWLAAAQQRLLALCLIGGVVLGLLLLGIETSADFPLYRMVKGDDPRLIGLVESKRSVDSLPLLVWPAALALARLGRPWIGAALALIFAAASVRLTASSATLGMAAALALFGLTFLSVPAIRRGLMGSVILAFAAILPVSIVAWNHGGTTALWLKRSGQHRVEIWHFAAGKALERPWFGHGFDSSRAIPNDGAVSQFLPPDKPIIPLHPHDAFLQIWLELGGVGVAIAVALLFSLLLAIGRLPLDAQRFALAGFGAAMVVAGLAFGIWQTWWIATLAFSAVATASIASGKHHA